MGGLLSISQAVEALKQNGIIVYPTESVFGFGCNPHNQHALEQLLNLKQRSMQKGLILVASAEKQIQPFINWSLVSDEILESIRASWPGPVTWVFPASDSVNPILTGPNQTIGIRISNHPVVKKLCDAYEGAVVSTSVNIANQKPLMEIEAIQETFQNQITGIVEGQLGLASAPSWVIDVQTQQVLRKGPLEHFNFKKVLS